MSFARSIGEFGAVVFIAGNLPGLTEIVSLLIYIRLDEYNYPAAAALATVLLAAAFVTLLAHQPGAALAAALCGAQA
jgi:sulfate transport system permease protein